MPSELPALRSAIAKTASGTVSNHGDSVSEALAKIWGWHDDYGLIEHLAVDAVMARTTAGELLLTAPRLLQLTIDGQLAMPDAALVIETIGSGVWNKQQRADLEALFDAWWLESLNLDVGEHVQNELGEQLVPSVVLGLLAHYDPAPMVRWLLVWVDQLDGPGARHLASFLISAEPESNWADTAWDRREEKRQEVKGWARTDAVIYGLTMVGATHLEPDALSDVLDQLI